MNLTIPITWNSEYATTNLTEASEIWNGINYDDGIIAIPYTLIDKMGLHRAQKHPWDPNYGVYLINGYHQIHCLVIIIIPVLPLDMLMYCRLTYTALSENMNLVSSRHFRCIMYCTVLMQCVEILFAMQTTHYGGQELEKHTKVGLGIHDNVETGAGSRHGPRHFLLVIST